MMIGRLMLAVCLVCFCANVADAQVAVAKVRELDAVPVQEPDPVDGVATLVYHVDKVTTDITVVITGFQPGQTYGVQFMIGDLPLVSDDAAITTNPAGNGNCKLSAPFDVTLAESMEVYVLEGENVTVVAEGDVVP